jgi:hypothetical protein
MQPIAPNAGANKCTPVFRLRKPIEPSWCVVLRPAERTGFQRRTDWQESPVAVTKKSQRKLTGELVEPIALLAHSGEQFAIPMGCRSM